ncbi:MAG: HK97 gp10 family phage protein [Acinetobacter sp.]
MSQFAIFSGHQDIERKLRELGSATVVRRITRKAARQSMNIVRDAAKENAKRIDDPVTREKIFKNISTSAGKTRDKNTIKMRVGVRGGASFSNPNPPNTSGGDTRHWRWIEFGKTGVPAVPFMRPALAMNIENVINKFSQVFVNELDAELAKL